MGERTVAQEQWKNHQHFSQQINKRNFRTSAIEKQENSRRAADMGEKKKIKRTKNCKKKKKKITAKGKDCKSRRQSHKKGKRTATGKQNQRVQTTSDQKIKLTACGLALRRNSRNDDEGADREENSNAVVDKVARISTP